MTQPSRTTESISRDHAAIRDIMHSIRELTVPDRATVAVGLVGHLATMMNRSQMSKLLDQLREEATRVQDVPPSRARDQEERTAAAGDESGRRTETGGSGARNADERHADGRDANGRDADAMRADGRPDGRGRGPVGQAGRGEFNSGDLV